MFPKKGKFYPDRRRRPGTEVAYEAVISAALRTEMRDRRCSVKTVMAWTGASERTVKNWLAAKSGPRGCHLMCLARHSPTILGATLQLSGRERAFAGLTIIEARDHLAATVQFIDGLIRRTGEPTGRRREP